MLIPMVSDAKTSLILMVGAMALAMLIPMVSDTEISLILV